MNILITGASKGIGFQLAKLFSKDKQHVVITIARNIDLLKKLQAECLSLNPDNQLKIISFDIEDSEVLQRDFKRKILKYVDSLDLLINNAGYLINKPFEEYSLEDIHKTVNINFISHSLIIQELIPLLQKGKHKHVVNISSMGGFQGSSKFPGLSFYSSSKAALANLTECLAEEYKTDGIKFNCLALGSVNTEMLREAFPGYNAPLDPDEMAKFIYDFSLNGTKYFNGKILPVSVTTP